jgi:hypothetical protein
VTLTISERHRAPFTHCDLLDSPSLDSERM